MRKMFLWFSVMKGRMSYMALVCVCVCEDKLCAFFQSFLLKNKYIMVRFSSSLRGKDDLWDCMGKHCFLTLKIR